MPASQKGNYRDTTQSKAFVCNNLMLFDFFVALSKCMRVVYTLAFCVYKICDFHKNFSVS